MSSAIKLHLQLTEPINILGLQQQFEQKTIVHLTRAHEWIYRPPAIIRDTKQASINYIIDYK